MTRKSLLTAVLGAVASVLGLAVWQVTTVTPPSTGASMYLCAASNGTRIAVASSNQTGTAPVQFDTTTDGVNWTKITSNLPADTVGTLAGYLGPFYGIAQLSGNGTYWLARSGRDHVYRSTDLQSWSLVYTAAAGGGVGMVYAGPVVSIIKVVSSSGAPSYATSTNGTAWTARTAPSYNTVAGSITQVVTVGSTVYAYMGHKKWQSDNVVWSSTDGVSWTNEYVLTTRHWGGARCAVALGTVPAFGLRYQRILAKVGGTWQLLTTGPTGQTERRLSASKAPAKFTDGTLQLAATPVVGLGLVGNEIVAALSPCVGLWTYVWPQAAVWHDGSTWTDQKAALGGSSTVLGRSDALPLPADSNDALYLGSREGETLAQWEINTAGSYTGLRVEYSTATGWGTAALLDRTAGLATSGMMQWAAPKDWAQVTLAGQPATMRALKWVRIVCDAVTTRAVGRLTGYGNEQQPLYFGGLYRVGGSAEPLQPWRSNQEIDCLLTLGTKVFAVCYDPEGKTPATVQEVR